MKLYVPSINVTILDLNGGTNGEIGASSPKQNQVNQILVGM